MEIIASRAGAQDIIHSLLEEKPMTVKQYFRPAFSIDSLVRVVYSDFIKFFDGDFECFERSDEGGVNIVRTLWYICVMYIF